MSAIDPDDLNRRIAEAISGGDATGWFEHVYAAAATGDGVVPWDRQAPHPALLAWVARRRPEGAGRPAVVVGCGLGDDAEMAATLGYATTAFDISPTAVRGAQERYPASSVTYVVADLFNLPAAWSQAFDLVIESQTVQALPVTLREAATAAVASLVAPGGTLVVQAVATDVGVDRPTRPPIPLTRAEIDRFAAHGLDPVDISRLPNPANPAMTSWCAEFQRRE